MHPHYHLYCNHPPTYPYIYIYIYIAHIWSPTLFPRGILIFQGVLTKFNFLTKFQHLNKYYINLMKDPKYEHQSTFALWGGQT